MTAALRLGRWRVWLAGEHCGDPRVQARRWLELVEGRAPDMAEPLHRSKHAATHRILVDGDAVYLKRYHRYRARTRLKDMVRASKARNAFRVSAALGAAGFTVPRVLAAAEERRGPLLGAAWLATAALSGVPMATRIGALMAARRAAAADEARRLLRDKRRLLADLGTAVGRLHACGFVAGDLVPPNVWSVDADGGIAFLDHDRTRAGTAPAPWGRARRNLVQLNRLVLPGIVTTDRLRVYRAYAVARGWRAADARRRLPWIVAKTIDRRRRFDGIDDAAARGFRVLMRAPGAGK